MFGLLTTVLLWLLIASLAYYVLAQLIPKANMAWFGTLILVVLIIGAFFFPNDSFLSSAWSILSFPLKPLGASLLLLFAGVMGIKKGAIKNPGIYQIWAALIILVISSTPFITYQLVQQAEREAIQSEQIRREICTDKCPVDLKSPATEIAGAIALIGQGTTKPNLPPQTQIQLTDTGNLIVYTSQLYQEQLRLGNKPIVIVSAGRRLDIEGNQIEADDITTLLIGMGIPKEQISPEKNALDIRSSAEQIKAILDQNKLSGRIILVTSALNIRRATLTFAQLGVKVIPRPTNFYTIQDNATPKRRTRVMDFVPNPESLLTTTHVIEEYFALIYYFLRGWLSLTIL